MAPSYIYTSVTDLGLLWQVYDDRSITLLAVCDEPITLLQVCDGPSHFSNNVMAPSYIYNSVTRLGLLSQV